MSQLNWQEGLPLLVTPRVVLRELRRSDAAALSRVARSPAVKRFTPSLPSSTDEFEAFVDTAWRERAAGRSTRFAVVPRDQTEPAGVFELRSMQPRFFRAELRLMLDPVIWEIGAFEDAVRLICQFGFNTAGVHRIEIRTSVANTQCNAALEKMGLHKEAVLRAAFAYDGGFEDQYLWAIVKGLDPLAAAP